MAIQKRQQRIFLAMAVALAVAVVLGLAGGALLSLAHGVVPTWAMVGASAAIVFIALAASLPFWRRLDEMAREAHATAWYWGGTAGLGIGLLSLIAVEGSRSPLVQGGMIVGLSAIAGYGFFWLGWWALRSSRAT
jgi:hypothetical protein